MSEHVRMCRCPLHYRPVVGPCVCQCVDHEIPFLPPRDPATERTEP